uniref:Uncharacterized protein n=1 Tax=Anguilla anguilla TaxID=7936 RepID=A0A0E9PRX1_ANGAN
MKMILFIYLFTRRVAGGLSRSIKTSGPGGIDRRSRGDTYAPRLQRL